MRSVNPRPRGGLSSRTAVLGVSAGAAVVVGVIATLLIAGQLQLFHRPIDHTGMVPVPICGRVIPAYTMVTRDYIWDTKANSLSVVWVPREAVHTDVFTQLGKILGRVTAREKAAQYLFKEADFLPEGTRPGLSAGVPPGKRAMTIEAGKLNGIYRPASRRPLRPRGEHPRRQAQFVRRRRLEPRGRFGADRLAPQQFGAERVRATRERRSGRKRGCSPGKR